MTALFDSGTTMLMVPQDAFVRTMATLADATCYTANLDQSIERRVASWTVRPCAEAKENAVIDMAFADCAQPGVGLTFDFGRAHAHMPGESLVSTQSVRRVDNFSDESRRRRGRDVDISPTNRGDAAAGTRLFRGVTATPRPGRG